jgi:hypothetical protein
LKKLLVAGVTALALAAGAAVVWAQAPPPVVNVTLGSSSIAVQGPSATPNAGPTRFVFSSTGGEREGFLFALEPGRTVDDLRAALATGKLAPVERLGTIEAGVAVGGRNDPRAVTVTLKPGVTYVAVDGSQERMSRWPLFAFAVGTQPNGATAPATDARVRIVDFGYRGDTRLPRNGTIRFENDGDEPHIAVAFPVRPGTSRAAKRALKRNDERRLGRYLNGPPVEPQGLISPGAVNDVEFRFPRRGTYVLVCFVQRHNELGMQRTVRVR